jgi:hypothetical protein
MFTNLSNLEQLSIKNKRSNKILLQIITHIFLLLTNIVLGIYSKRTVVRGNFYPNLYFIGFISFIFSLLNSIYIYNLFENFDNLKTQFETSFGLCLV